VTHPVVDYYFGVPSPWTYLAGPRLEKLTEKYNLKVNWKPYDVSRVFALTGTKPVLERPPQIQANRLNELRRWREHLGMPLNLHPKFFPIDPHPSAHMLISAKQAGGEISKLANAYMKAFWAEEKNITDCSTLISIADKLGWDGETVFNSSSGADVHEEYKKNSEEAVKRNVFGTPTWIYENQLFWGQDRLSFLSRAIEEKL
tara:strand:- start:54 stop:659 length:606 start_codon:yes stop_codon:yes gene_type:complete